MTTNDKRLLIKSALIASVVVWSADTLYKLVKDITFVNREQCVLFRALPKPAFVLFEYVFETLVIVFVGTFIAVWLGRQFLRFRRFFPRSPVTAFFYGAMLPVCSCAVIPMVSSMRGRLKFSTVAAFIIAAPMLSPYIIALSFSVLGPTYGVLRVLSAFVLTMVCACVLSLAERRTAGARSSAALPNSGDLLAPGELFASGQPLARGSDAAYVLPQVGAASGVPTHGWARRALAMVRPSCPGSCAGGAQDIYFEAFAMFKRLLPYLVLAGLFGVGLEYLGPRSFLMRGGFGDGVAEVAIWSLVGVPLYFCNGAEVFFLRPLVSHGFPLGTAIAFSLTSTAVCVTSLAMLLKLIGSKLTSVLGLCVPAVAIWLALMINALF